MKKYGWDIYRKEGLEELKRVADSRYFTSKPEQQRLLDTYAEVYSKREDYTIKGVEFYPERDYEVANKSASKNIQALRASLAEFYKTAEGRSSGFELYFIAAKRDYRLGIRPLIEEVATETSSQPGTVRREVISYMERPVLGLKYTPYLVFSISIIVLGLIAVLFISGWIFVIESYSTLLFVVFLAIFIVLALISVNALRLHEKKFAFFILRYFLRASGKNLVLASYSGTCPVCDGEVNLSSTRLERKGYIAKCCNNPDSHIFTFDHVTLKGERV